MKSLLLSLATAWLAITATAWSAPNSRPNVVILYADDWRFDTLGCAGNPVVKTPELDRLATRGVRFTYACATTPICGVSRASLFTGQWMSRHGNRGFSMFTTPWEQTFPGLLRTNGYFVGHIGKWHNGKFPARQFDFGRSYSGKHWITEADGSKIHVTKKNERDALEFLRARPRNQPFCLTLAFFAPHAEDQNPRQFLPQPESMPLYKEVRIPVPVTASDEALRRLPPFLQNSNNEARIRWHWRFDSPVKYQQMMKNYFRLCSEVDAVCGKVIAELEAQGLLTNTLVIFTGDNGYFHSEHQLADKWYPYQESIRVPLIVLDPRLPANRKGSTNDALALNVDVAPTILTAAGIAVPPTMQGRDLTPLYLAKSAPAWRTEFFEEHGTITSKERIPSSEALVRKDVKYIVWPEWNYEELFDLKSDPLELTNLIREPGWQTRVKSLRMRFAELKAQAN